MTKIVHTRRCFWDPQTEPGINDLYLILAALIGKGLKWQVERHVSLFWANQTAGVSAYSAPSVGGSVFMLRDAQVVHCKSRG